MLHYLPQVKPKLSFATHNSHCITLISFWAVPYIGVRWSVTTVTVKQIIIIISRFISISNIIKTVQIVRSHSNPQFILKIKMLDYYYHGCHNFLRSICSPPDSVTQLTHPPPGIACMCNCRDMYSQPS